MVTDVLLIRLVSKLFFMICSRVSVQNSSSFSLLALHSYPFHQPGEVLFWKCDVTRRHSVTSIQTLQEQSLWAFDMRQAFHIYPADCCLLVGGLVLPLYKRTWTCCTRVNKQLLSNGDSGAFAAMYSRSSNTFVGLQIFCHNKGKCNKHFKTVFVKSRQALPWDLPPRLSLWHSVP